MYLVFFKINHLSCISLQTLKVENGWKTVYLLESRSNFPKAIISLQILKFCSSYQHLFPTKEGPKFFIFSHHNHYLLLYAGTVKCYNVCKRHFAIDTGFNLTKLNVPFFSTGDVISMVLKL